jgi:hypothetical protein
VLTVKAHCAKVSLYPEDFIIRIKRKQVVLSILTFVKYGFLLGLTERKRNSHG